MSCVNLAPSFLLFFNLAKNGSNLRFLLTFRAFFSFFEDEVSAFEVSDILEPTFLA